MSASASSLSQEQDWKTILLDGYKNNVLSGSELLGNALFSMIGQVHKILPVKYQRKGLFNKSIQSSFSAQSLIECIGKVFASNDEKFADYVGMLMGQFKMIEVEGQFSELSLDRKKVVRFLHPYMPRLVIIGGGHSGFTTACQLHEYFSIVLIDVNDNCSLKPAYPGIVENIDHSNKISVKYSQALPQNVTFIQGLVKLVRQDGVFIDLIGTEPQGKHLFGNNTASDDDIKNCKYLTFDYLVVSSGSNAWRNLPSYDSSNGENKILYIDTYQMDKVKEAVNIINQNNNSQSVIVIGGGMVGCEFFGSLAQTYPNREFYLIQRSEMLMRPSSDAHKAAIETFEKFKNAHVLLNTQVVRQSDPNTLLVKSSKTEEEILINCCVCFMASGTSPNTTMMKDHFASSLDQGGFLQVNSSFQLLKDNSEHYHNIFVLGDVNNADSEKLMQNANFHAQKFVEIAKSIVQLETKDLPTYETGPRVMAVSLGSKTGFVLKDKKVLFKSGIVITLKNVIQSTTVKGYNKYMKD